MKYLSVCSGIEAATVAWHSLGWSPVAFSEIEKFPSSVLAHHYPDVPNLGDMTKHESWPDEPIDILVGGTPCQSFSVAGLRKGLADPRGNLALTYLAIAASRRAEWVVWENVPGVLSSNGGRDFGSFLGALGQLGYGFAYRVLDAQYFGVAQRRRRVFVVGCAGSWRRAAAVLFERESLSGDSAPSREAGQDIAQCLTTGTGKRYDPETETLPVAFGVGAAPDLAHCLRSGASKADEHESTTYINVPAIAGTMKACKDSGGFSNSADHAAAGYMIPQAGSVRRLTPRECERLQGFPDDYTLTPYRGKPAADGPRYKALGNSMAVPVMRWIGQRIAAA